MNSLPVCKLLYRRNNECHLRSLKKRWGEFLLPMVTENKLLETNGIFVSDDHSEIVQGGLSLVACIRDQQESGQMSRLLKIRQHPVLQFGRFSGMI